MSKKIKGIVSTIVFAVLLFSFSVTCYVKPDGEYSISERRALAAEPDLSVATIADGSYMADFEAYTTDQFPFREELRYIKTAFSFYGMRKLENNGLFMSGGHISKIDEKANPDMQDYAAQKFRYLYDKYLNGKTANVYFSIVPDKNFVIAEKAGYPSMDYGKFIDDMKSKTSYMKYIDITPFLSIDDYYTTDTHWRQEAITDIASAIASDMGTDISAKYTVNTLENPFYGVYYNQLKLPFEPDTINYLTNDTINKAQVKYVNNMGKLVDGEMYDMKKADGKDPYEMFLSGVAPLVTIENPNAKTTKELVMFRDSYGSSLAPLFVEGYKKITVVDIRYMISDAVGAYVDFNNADVLFIYSTSILNNSTALR